MFIFLSMAIPKVQRFSLCTYMSYVFRVMESSIHVIRIVKEHYMNVNV